MKIEHFALNVAEPTAMAAWYGDHLGLRVVRHIPEPNQTHFLADSADATVMEIYRNPAAPVPDYATMDPLVLHVAFLTEDAAADAARLTEAGAQLVDELNFPDGSLILMLRDPWGLALQLCQRAKPLL
jgi:glyoxylase I family protein